MRCDAHFHVFGPAERYPARDPKLRYPPPLAPLEDYRRLPRQLGLGGEEDASGAELARLHEIAVRGGRLNGSPIHPPEAAVAATPPPRHPPLRSRRGPL